MIKAITKYIFICQTNIPRRVNACENGVWFKFVVDLVPEGGPEAIGLSIFWGNINGKIAHPDVVAILPFCHSCGFIGANVVSSVRFAFLFSEVIHFYRGEDVAAVQHKNGVWRDVLTRKQALAG